MFEQKDCVMVNAHKKGERIGPELHETDVANSRDLADLPEPFLLAAIRCAPARPTSTAVSLRERRSLTDPKQGSPDRVMTTELLLV